MNLGPAASPSAGSSFEDDGAEAEAFEAGQQNGENFDDYDMGDMDGEGSPLPPASSSGTPFQLGAWARRRAASSSPQSSRDGIDSSVAVDQDDAASTASGGAGPAARLGAVLVGPVHAISMGDYNSRHMGQGVNPTVPLFSQGTSSNAIWQCYSDVDEGTRCFRPVRAMVWNVPAELMDVDGKRFRHWSTPHSNTARAHYIAAVLGMAFTGTSKGFLCAAAARACAPMRGPTRARHAGRATTRRPCARTARPTRTGSSPTTRRNG